MPRQAQVLALLTDGCFHSGESLAEALGCSRSAVWKQVEVLRKSTGLEIQAVAGRGYRLARPLELLNHEVLLDSLSSRARASLGALYIEALVESTNQLALDALSAGLEGPAAWIAEHQSHGRGRRGRRWHSPFGRNLYLSLCYPFDLPMARLAGLSLAMGVAVSEALVEEGLEGHGIKWPNDIYWEDAKLGGLLIEIRGEAGGPAQVVIGFGLNIDLGEQVPEWIDQPVVDLVGAGVRPSRNRLAGRVLESLLDGCETFAAEGLGSFVHRFEPFDICRGRQVHLVVGDQCFTGVAEGVDADGGLRLGSADQIRVFHGGEVSLRLEGRDG